MVKLLDSVVILLEGGSDFDLQALDREEAAAVANEAYERAPSWMKLCEAVGLLKPNNSRLSGGMHILDSIVPAQGPNYILSKRLQHWRAMVARAGGHTVSSNISPSFSTLSIVSFSMKGCKAGPFGAC